MPKKQKTYKVIAGCNSVGSMNWGDWGSTVPLEVKKQWLENLLPHIGKEVFLSGGGGRGYSKAMLKGAEMDEHENVVAHLTDVKSMTGRSWYSGGEEAKSFDPHLGSWQIIVEVKG